MIMNGLEWNGLQSNDKERARRERTAGLQSNDNQTRRERTAGLQVGL